MNYLSILLVIAALYASDAFHTHHQQPKSYNKLKLVTSIKPVTSCQYVSNFDKLPVYRSGINLYYTYLLTHIAQSYV